MNLEQVKPLSDIVQSIKTLIEPGIQSRDSREYDKLFSEAHHLIHSDQSCLDRLRTLIESNKEDAPVKDASKATEYRDKGNKYFQKENYSEALNCYNQSLMVSPCPENFKQQSDFVEFALSLTNRFKSDFR